MMHKRLNRSFLRIEYAGVRAVVQMRAASGCYRYESQPERLR